MHSIFYFIEMYNVRCVCTKRNKRGTKKRIECATMKKMKEKNEPIYCIIK